MMDDKIVREMVRLKSENMKLRAELTALQGERDTLRRELARLIIMVHANTRRLEAVADAIEANQGKAEE